MSDEHYETCSKCGGSGMTIRDNGEPGLCYECRGNTVVRADLVARLTRERDAAEAAALERAGKSAISSCQKCGGAGWLWGHELANYDNPHPGQADDTRYSCDGEGCAAASTIRYTPRDGSALDAVVAERTKGLRDALVEIDALDPEGGLAACSDAAVRGLVLRMGATARAAIAKLEGDGA